MSKPKVLYLSYVHGVNKRIEQGCRNLGVFKSRHTVFDEHLEQNSEGMRTWGGVCVDCDSFYIGEMGRSLKDRIKEHRYAVNRGDMKNGVAAHAWGSQHKVDWSSAKVRTVEQFQ